MKVLHFSTEHVALIRICGGIGGLVGAAAANSGYVHKNMKLSYGVSLFLPSVAVVVICLSEFVTAGAVSLALVCAAEFLFVAAIVLCVVVFNSLRQSHSPENMVGQIAASERVLALCGEIPGGIFGGLFAAALSHSAVLWVAAIAMAASVIWVTHSTGWDDEKDHDSQLVTV